MNQNVIITVGFYNILVLLNLFVKLKSCCNFGHIKLGPAKFSNEPLFREPLVKRHQGTTSCQHVHFAVTNDRMGEGPPGTVK